MASKENPIRKVFDGRPMLRHFEGAKEKFGRCVVEKSERSATIDTKMLFTIMGEQNAYALGSFLPNFKSDFSWFCSDPVHMQNLHVYHVHEDDSYVGKM